MTGHRSVRAASLLLLAVVLGACDGPDARPPMAAGSSGTPVTSHEIADRGCRQTDFDLGDVGRFFRPPMRTRGGRTVLPLTFLDGSSARLSVARDLDVVSRGITVDGSGSVGDFGRALWIWHARLDQLLIGFGCPRLLHSYERNRGAVGLWHFPRDVEIDYLAFPFGAWTVLVYDYSEASVASPAHMTHEARRAWVTNLRGRETRTGFLVLDDSPPLDISGATSRRPPTMTLNGRDGRAVLTSGVCEPGRRQARSEWCLGGRVGIVALGPDEFARSLRRSLSLESFRPAPK